MLTVPNQNPAERPRQYWAFCADPANYRIEDAVRELRDDSWNVLRSDGRELHVEVKGTSADGSAVLLTRNEVEHARQHRAITALCVVTNIHISNDTKDAPEPSGGYMYIIEP